MSIISFSGLFGFVTKYKAFGRDFVFFKDKIVIYDWSGGPNKGVITPQAGGSAGIPGVAKVSVGVDYFTSYGGKVHGNEVGPAIGIPSAELHTYEADYHIVDTISVNPIEMLLLKDIFFNPTDWRLPP